MPRLSRVDVALTLLLTVSFDVLTWWSVEISVIFALLLRILSVTLCYYLSVTPAIIEPISVLWSTILKLEVKMGVVFLLVVACAVSSYVRCLGAGVLTFRCLVVLDNLDKIEKHYCDLLSWVKGSKLVVEGAFVSDSHISTPEASSTRPNISISVQSGTNVSQPILKPAFVPTSTLPKSQMRSSLQSSPRSTQSHVEQPKPLLSVIQSSPCYTHPLQRQQRQVPEERPVSRKHDRDNDDDPSTINHNQPLYDSEKLSLVPAPKARRVVIHPFQTQVADEESLMDIVIASNHNNKKTSTSHAVHLHRPVLKRKVHSHQEEDIEVIQDWMEDNSRTKRRKFLELEQMTRPSTITPATKGADAFSLPAASASSSTTATFGSTFAFDSSSASTATVSAPKHVSFTVSTNGDVTAPSAPASVTSGAPCTFITTTAAPTDASSSVVAAPSTSFAFAPNLTASSAPSTSVAESFVSKPEDRTALPAAIVAGGEKTSAAFGFSVPQTAPATASTTSSTPAFNLLMPTTGASTTTTASSAPILSIPPISTGSKDGGNSGMFSLPSPSRRPPTVPSPSSQANKAAVPFGIAFSGKGAENQQPQSQANAASAASATPFTFGLSGAASTIAAAPPTFGFPSSNPPTASTTSGMEAKTTSSFGSSFGGNSASAAALSSAGGPFSSTPLPSSAGPSFPGFESTTSAPAQQSSGIFGGGLTASTAPFSATSTVASSFGSSDASTVTSGTLSQTSTVTSQQNPFGAKSSFPSGAPAPATTPTASFGAAFGQQAAANPFGTSAFPTAGAAPAAATASAFGGSSSSNAFNPFASSGTTPQQQQAPKGGFGFGSGASASVSAAAPAPAASNPFSSSMAPTAATFGSGSAAFAGGMPPSGNPFGHAQPFGSAAPNNPSGLPLAPTLSSNPSFSGSGPFGSSSAAAGGSTGQMQFAGALGASMPLVGQSNAGFGGGAGGRFGGGDFNAGGAGSSMIFQSKGPPKGKVLAKKILSHKK